MRPLTLLIGILILGLVACVTVALIITPIHWTPERLCLWPALVLAGAGGVGFVMSGIKPSNQ